MDSGKKTLWIRRELLKPLIIGMTAILAKDLPIIEKKAWVCDPTGRIIVENSQVKAYPLQWTVELSDGFVSILPFIQNYKIRIKPSAYKA